MQHFPEDWVPKNLPNLNRLKQTGITFKNAQTSTCACSPARATLWTSLYPSTHLAYRVGMDLPPNSRNQLNIIGNVLKSAGYQVVYKGKWDLTDSLLATPSCTISRLNS
ncbi:MAG: sulfatase-like hydrolase/transferase [Cyanobacteria bacterium P01_E01_bin.42]